MDDDETNQQTNDPAKQFRTLLLAKTKNLSLFIKDMQRRRVHSLVFNSTKYQQISPSFIMFDTSKEREKGGENLIIQKKWLIIIKDQQTNYSNLLSLFFF